MSAPRFLDTSILLYSISRAPDEADKRRLAEALIDFGDNAVSVQVLEEFYGEATRPSRKDALPPDIATALLRTWLRFRVQDITVPLMLGALELKAAHRLSYREAAVIAAARALGCREVLSTDMPHGREVEGVTVIDPFR